MMFTPTEYIYRYFCEGSLHDLAVKLFTQGADLSTEFSMRGQVFHELWLSVVAPSVDGASGLSILITCAHKRAG